MDRKMETKLYAYASVLKVLDRCSRFSSHWTLADWARLRKAHIQRKRQGWGMNTITYM